MNEGVKILKNGGIGVMATDTIYGIVGQALNQNTVERIHSVKKRTPTKPFIILISSIDDLLLFHIQISPELRRTLKSYWPGPVSIILDCHRDEFEYLHRGTKSLAFRLPASPELQEIIRTTGPLVAPSANPESLAPAQTVDEAKAYFNDSVDFYIQGNVNENPSKIIKVTNDAIEVIRP